MTLDPGPFNRVTRCPSAGLTAPGLRGLLLQPCQGSRVLGPGCPVGGGELCWAVTLNLQRWHWRSPSLHVLSL